MFSIDTSSEDKKNGFIIAVVGVLLMIGSGGAHAVAHTNGMYDYHISAYPTTEPADTSISSLPEAEQEMVRQASLLPPVEDTSFPRAETQIENSDVEYDWVDEPPTGVSNGDVVSLSNDAQTESVEITVSQREESKVGLFLLFSVGLGIVGVGLKRRARPRKRLIKQSENIQ